MKRFLILASLGLCMAVGLTGCALLQVVSEAGTAIGTATGAITPGQAESIKRSATAVGKAMADITPEQEYYLGRAVAATILKTYKPYDHATANQYLNTMGQALAAASDKPETFKGYRFLIMDTDEINAFAAPSGYVLVSRGLIRCCPNESALASVLAHEVGHVQHGHGLQAISQKRWTSAATILAVEAGKNLAGEQLAELTTAFEGTITDITGTMVNSGYARKLEGEADKAAITIMQRVGYDPNGLKTMLVQMQQRMQGGDHRGFGATHPSPEQRIKAIEPLLRNTPAPADYKARQDRFEKFLKSI